MADEVKETKKPAIEYVAPVRSFDNENCIVVQIANPLNKLEKFGIVWEVPSTDEEAQARYDCTLKDLITQGVRNLSTRPDYPLKAASETKQDGKKTVVVALHDDAHERMQAAADEYRVGKRTTTAGPTVKAKAAKLDATQEMLAENGLTLDQLMEQAREAGIIS